MELGETLTPLGTGTAEGDDGGHQHQERHAGPHSHSDDHRHRHRLCKRKEMEHEAGMKVGEVAFPHGTHPRLLERGSVMGTRMLLVQG